MREYLLVFLVAVGTTYLFSGLCRTIAVRTGALATVRNRDVHTYPIPYYGGVAMFGGLAIALFLAVQMPFLGRHASVGYDATAVIWAALIICAIGVLDDKYDLPALVKLGGQVLAAGVAVLGGVRIFWIPLPDRIISLDPATSILITVLFIAVCVNAVNFVDGLDGLAAGVVAIGSGAFFSYSYFLAYEQDFVRATTASLITVATCGIAVGFLFHNYHPAKMFMGDSGAMLLGMLMAMSAISFTGQMDPSVLENTGDLLPALLPILLPLAAIALPLLDLTLAWVRRTWKGQHVFAADKQHLHHRLIARGHSHWGAVLLMWGWSAVFSIGLVVIGLTGTSMAVWGVAAAVVLIGVLTIWPVRSTPYQPVQSTKYPVAPAAHEAGDTDD
ncbi:MAG TPA: undecaprenyl/decaprenyl-phosphate alpha-N-acetylglucosaminyl 1-phosphate transferase [Tessaracoccus flavescens]|uniref:Undecaprenyl/decaprenyl-phosphate alpha-N-acetylglucosaminyl 1-phosphate transferase n=1 Tax=Tessaracoccus flavescens TaxID=399497 RepID=A0A921ERH0_9ACTN|nr:undecaprenyl/decaprenyl-phosphate alpha-N-acetylglucosaminyl 1-phosphate transferase [Tessaracoccus flavescens]